MPIDPQLRAEAEAKLLSPDSDEVPGRPAEALLHELQVHQIELEMQNEALRQTQIALEESRDRYVDLYEFAPVGYLTLTSQGLISRINLTGASLLGVERKNLPHQRFASFVIGEDRDRWHQHFLRLTRSAGRGIAELVLQRGDGTVFTAQLDCMCEKVIADDTTTHVLSGSAPSLRIALTDISERKAFERQQLLREADLEQLVAERTTELQAWGEQLERRVAERTAELHAAEAKYRLIAENAGDLIAMLDREGRRLYASPSFQAYFPDDQVTSGADSLAIVHPEDKDRIRQIFIETVETGKGRRAEFRCISKDGRIHHFESESDPVRDASGRVSYVVAVSRDITERRAAEEQVRYLAHHDMLTGLPNRALFSERIDHALTQARRRHSRVAVMFVDLDRFKVFNDSLGHLVGDRLLKVVAERLRACLREEDTVARLGGDEFAVLINDCEGEQTFAMIAQKVIDALGVTIMVDERELNVGASIGISVYPDDGDSAETLLEQSDMAMYQVKSAGRNHIRFYTPQMNERAQRRMTVENGLRRALSRGELVVHYQPEIDLASGALVAVEALIRWQHPEMGLLLPETFIEIAEDTGLVVPIGEWVLLQACTQQRVWQDANLIGPAVVMSVNLSALQFQQKDLIATVKHCLAQSGLQAHALELEITETTLMKDAGTSVAMLRTLDELGVSTVVDDFGTGYSSLAYLKRFPVRKLKVDRSFVREADTDPDDDAIVRAVVSLGHSLKLSIVAEGVETASQAAFLRGIGCNTGQGYFFAAPSSDRAATRWLAEMCQIG